MHDQPTTPSDPSAPIDRGALTRSVAALTAVYLVTHALLISRFPWFVDEGLFARYAQLAEGDRAQRFAALVDQKGLVNSWLGALMIHADISPMVAMRLLSVASGLVIAAATAFVVARWRRSTTETIAAFALGLFLPYLFVHDAVAVYDAFIAAGSMVALALQLSLARRVRLDATLLLGITFGLLLLSKPTGALAIALAPVSLLVFDWDAPERIRRLARWAAAIGLATLLGLTMFALTRLSPLAYQPGPDNHRSIGDLLRDPFENFGYVAPDALAAIVGYLTIPLLLIGLWGAVRAIQLRDRTGGVLILWSLAAIAAFLLLTDNAYPRYGLQLAPPFIGLVILGASDLAERLAERRSRRTVLALGTLAVLPAVALDVWVVAAPESAPYPGLDRGQYVSRLSNRQPVRHAAEEILRLGDDVTYATPVAERTVAQVGGWPEVTIFVLNGRRYSTNPKFPVVEQYAGPEAVNAARFVIVDGPPPPWLNVPATAEVRRWNRPDGGPTTILYDRAKGRSTGTDG